MGVNKEIDKEIDKAVLIVISEETECLLPWHNREYLIRQVTDIYGMIDLFNYIEDQVTWASNQS